MSAVNTALIKKLNLPQNQKRHTGTDAEIKNEIRKNRRERLDRTSDYTVEKTLAVTREPKLGYYSPELSHRAKTQWLVFQNTWVCSWKIK